MQKYLKYSLDTGSDKQLKFQIELQSPVVDKFFEFLAKMGKDSYLTKAGYKIARSRFPEFKISTNTIYLRGSMNSQNYKVDVTRFPNNNTYRKGAEKLLDAALEEFITEVKKAERKGLLDDYNVYTVFGDPKPIFNTPNWNPMASMNTRSTRPVSNVESWLCNKVRPVEYDYDFISIEDLMPRMRSTVKVISL